MPVFAWDCKGNEICHNVPLLIIYSKDLDKIYEYHLYRKENEDGFSLLNFGETDSVDKEVLEKNKGHEIFLIYNERYHFLLDKKNRKTGARLYDLEIRGGYYKKFGIGISLEKLINDKNLYKFNI